MTGRRILCGEFQVSDTVEQKAEKAVNALRALERAALAECGISASEMEEERPPIEVNWTSNTGASELAAQVFEKTAQEVSRNAPFHSGRVYCYYCASSACEHNTPELPGEVFTGYTPMGLPVWEEFFRYLLSLEDDRTERLFDRPPEILARVVGRRRLIGDQLPSFGRNSLSYRVIGQVTAGYLNVENIRCALTVQLVETKGHIVHLQLVAPEKVKEALAEVPEGGRSVFSRVSDALSEARRKVTSLSATWEQARSQKARDRLRNDAFSILKKLAQSMERQGRQQRRRTRHAEQRGAEKRPVHKAREDLLNATDADIMLDRMKHSVIVCGKSGRVHVFSRQGKHITSMLLGQDEVNQRVHRKRYTCLAADEVQTFRRKATAKGASDAAESAHGEGNRQA